MQTGGIDVTESDDQITKLSELLHEAAETHHVVYRIVDGDDPDWASWYADWLLDLSELPELLGVKPVRSHLVHALVQLDRDYTAETPSKRWEEVYARALTEQFGR
jgi:hypothetical protein